MPGKGLKGKYVKTKKKQGFRKTKKRKKLINGKK